MTQPLLHVEHLEKTFGGVYALQDVSFRLAEKSIHGLCGPNGAGKSTFIRILSGVYPAGSYRGLIALYGVPVHFRNVQDARRAGIAVIHQELSIVGPLTVADNICLGYEPNQWGMLNRVASRRRAIDLLAQLRMPLDVDMLAAHLSTGTLQMVAIARALWQQSRLLILDEPTTALSQPESNRLFELLRLLRRRGTSMLYISHKLSELLALCDSISVMRDGTIVDTRPAREWTDQQLASALTARQSYPLQQAARPKARPALQVEGLTMKQAPVAGMRQLQQISFHVDAGEIVGIVGLLGSGRSELMLTLFGLWPDVWQGKVMVRGIPVHFRNPRQAIRAGLALVTEDRKRTGLILHHSVHQNLSLASLPRTAIGGILHHVQERRLNRQMGDSLRLQAPTYDHPVFKLSGGNQQKVVLGKWLRCNPSILLLDEPTQGVDISARAELYDYIRQIARKGTAVLLASSDMTELLTLCQRVLVMREGRIVAAYSAQEAAAETLLAAASGLRTE